VKPAGRRTVFHPSASWKVGSCSIYILVEDP
jgi:hypothetical protein